jgi:geranylgeranylglycerol-phosphate geranylgeranyltransferase
MNTFSAFLKILRPLNIFQSIVAVIITATFFEKFPPLMTLILVALTVACFLGAGNAINDYFDFPTDKINRPNRPLVRGYISKAGALFFSILLFLTGIIVFIPVATPMSTIILLLNLILLIIYTPCLKATVFWGNITVSYLLGSTFIFGAEIFGNPATGVIPALLAFSFNLARELIKDLEDETGDRVNSLNTLPVVYGKKAAKNIASLLIILILTGCFLPFLFKIYGKLYLITVVISVEIPLLFVLYLVQISKAKKDFSRISGLMKILVFFGLLSVYLGKY